MKETRPRFSCAFVAAGLLLLGYAAYLDASERRDAPWNETVISVDGSPQWPGTIPIRARWLPFRNYPARERLYTELRGALPRKELQALGLDRTELLIVAYAPEESFAPLLDTGRLPRAGYPEVLAGAFASLDEVHADDGHFQVVGRLKRNVAGMATAYLMPAHEVWEPLFERTTKHGWLDPRGLEKVRERADPNGSEPHPELLAMPAAGRNDAALIALFALCLIAAGGAGLHRWAFARLSARGAGVFGPALRAFGEHRRTVSRMHEYLYATFFLAMAAAISAPHANAVVMTYITQAFTEGSLGYIGRAYASGNVFAAAAATWVNNYLLQTVVMTAMISFVVPCIGVLKTWASFALAGFGMAPIWAGMPGTLSYHSITMVLELEAYIYTCAAVVISWMRAGRALRQGRLAPLKDGFKIVASGTLLAGVLLAVAGLYEATTLILIR